MKICGITSVYSPYEFGGSSIYANNITLELSNRGYENVVITINPFNGERFEKEKNINIYRFHPFNLTTIQGIGRKSLLKQAIWSFLDVYSYYSYRMIRKVLIKEKPDVVHVHTPIDMTLSVFNAVKSLGLPLVFTLHDYLLLCRRVTLLHSSGKICTDKNINPLCKIYRKVVRTIVDDKVDIVTAPSQFALDILSDDGFFKKTKKVVVPHGVILGDADYCEKTKRDKGEKDLNFLYVGGLTKNKGVQVLIEAVKQISSDNIKLHIVGNGVYELDLKQLAKNDKRIIFYGKLERGKIGEFYNSADVLIVPSIWYETFGRVILEAFRAGTAVICSNIGGMPELVIDNYNGYLFEAGKVDQLRKALNSIIADPNKLKRLQENAYKSSKEYSFSKCVDKLVEIYGEAIQINRSKE